MSDSLGISQRHYELAAQFTVLSMVGSLIVVLIILSLGLYEPKLVGRVSLRLQAGVSLADFILSIANHRFTYNPSPAWCAINGTFRLAAQLAYCTLNLCIAINLHLIMVHHINPRLWWERLYWGGSLSFVIIAVTPMYFLGYFGYNGRGCFISKGVDESNIIVSVLVNYSPIATLVYCSVVSILVVVRLPLSLRNVDQVTVTHYHQASLARPIESRLKLQTFARTLALRTLLYPISCFVCYSGLSLLAITQSLNVRSKLISEWALIGLTLGGFANFLAFIIDPTFHLAVLRVHDDLRAWYHHRRFSGSGPVLGNEGETGTNTVGYVKTSSIVDTPGEPTMTNEELIKETSFM